MNLRICWWWIVYLQFQHVPLFLEWAPVDVYTTPAPSVKQAVTTEEKDKKEGTETTVKEEEKEEQDEKKTEKVTFQVFCYKGFENGSKVCIGKVRCSMPWYIIKILLW